MKALPSTIMASSDDSSSGSSRRSTSASASLSKLFRSARKVSRRPARVGRWPTKPVRPFCVFVNTLEASVVARRSCFRGLQCPFGGSLAFGGAHRAESKRSRFVALPSRPPARETSTAPAQQQQQLRRRRQREIWNYISLSDYFLERGTMTRGNQRENDRERALKKVRTARPNVAPGFYNPG